VARDHVEGAGALANRLRRLSLLDRLDEAQTFLEMHARASGAGAAALRRRRAEVSRDLVRFGHYDQTYEELTFGAKLAWRNHARCIGRLFWESLVVRDRRQITEPQGIFADLCDHLAEAQGHGRIRSIISIYPPARPDGLPAHVESPQLVQYAGYLGADGAVTGDRRAIEATRTAQALGWEPPAVKGAFDVLPVRLRDGAGGRHLFGLPPDLVREVPIAHPRFPALSRLGLRWYAVPVVSDMILTIGGIEYPCAPFNGFYTCTEIASRNLADRGRYDLLPEIARCLGLRPGASDPFWRDTALTELNRAVQTSFQNAGVTMVDHHTASNQFMRFHGREGAAGRPVSADWPWIVPPQATAATEVFHLEMRDLRTVPAFYRNRSGDGQGLCPHRADLPRTLLGRAADALRRWTNQ
jgi:nitric-oxide synthase